MERLHRLLYQNRAVLKGHFRLSSGLHSDTYVQCARILQYPWYGEELGQALAERIREQAEPDCIVSPALGAILIGYEVARALQVPFLFTERVNGTMTLRREQQIVPGTTCWIVEDVITTGKSTREVAEVIEQHDGQVLGCAAIIDRRPAENADLPWPCVALLRMEMATYAPDACPLCEQGVPLLTPGSRKG